MTFTFDETNINYEVFGQGKPAVVLHGWGASVASVMPIVNELARGFRVLALDMPGCGKSGQPKAPLDLPDYARLVTALCEKEGVENPVLVGHSNGGLVALYLNVTGFKAYRNVLIDCTGVRRKKGVKVRLKIALFKISKAALSLFGERGRKIVDARREKYASEDYKNASPVMRKTMSNLLSWHLEKDLSKITAPTLLVWGEKDTATPLYMAKKIEKRVADCGTVVLSGAGHFSYLDRPAQFNAVLHSFLEF